jgi:hypothetical protein
MVKYDLRIVEFNNSMGESLYEPGIPDNTHPITLSWIVL